MELDNFWVEPRQPRSPPVTFDPPLRVTAGWMTTPAASFRGKCCAEFIEWVTGGVDLHGDLDADTVRHVATELEAFLPHATELARMFRAYGDAGYRLVACS
jgi:hypothetical protein